MIIFNFKKLLNQLSVILLVFLLFFVIEKPSVFAETLTPEAVVKRSLIYYPLVIDALNQVEVARANQDSVNSVFDTKLKGSVNSRMDGFYTGDIYKAQIEKQLSFLNSKVYGGYRQSTGSFPGYEGKLETLSDGEGFIGLSVSLLRNGIVDINRLNSFLADEDLSQSKEKLNQVKLKVQTMALYSYWNWVVAGARVKVYQEILDLAQVRMKGIKRRIQKGDLARIYKSENQQYIAKRKADLEKAKYNLNEASLFLSLFNRSQKGQPIVPALSTAPDIRTLKHSKYSNSKELTQRALFANPNLKILNSKLEQSRSNFKFGRVNMLPKLDLGFELSEDNGSGSATLNQQEQRFMLSFELPLENRKSRSIKNKAQAKINSVMSQKILLKDEIRRDLNALIIKLNTLSELVNITNEQVDLSTKLVKAEQKKFKSGASDLILLNLREELLAESKIKNLDTYGEYFSLKAKLSQLKVELIVNPNTK